MFLQIGRYAFPRRSVGTRINFILKGLSTFTLLCFFTVSLISCDVLNSPSEIEWPNNPFDGRNPDVVPEVLSINTSTGNGFTNRTNTAIYLQTKVAHQIRIGEVPSQGAEVTTSWQAADTLVNIQITSGDGEKWIGCQAKALNGNESTIKYTSIKLDTRVAITSFIWSSTGGDTLVPDDLVSFTMLTSDDVFGSETGGTAVVMVEGWNDIDLVGLADGSYTGSYTITDETPEVSNARVVVSFRDRSGNETVNESNQCLTAWWTLAPAPGEERTFPLGNSGEDIVMCWIPSGDYMMGAQDVEGDAYSDELPRHRVILTEGFWLGKYEVTQAQWEAVAGYENFNWPGNPGRPAEIVSWNDIHGDFLSELDNSFRLPTEAEWEYACRGGVDDEWFFFGSSYSNLGDYAWYYYNSSSRTHDVGGKDPNPWGLHDMHGNVYEWCEDWCHSDYTNAPDDGSAWELPSGSYRVYRGGDWGDYAHRCRSAFRNGGRPSYRYDFLGFRLARDEGN